MATSREHFALDWIKGELLETLNTARGGLETFAEALENGSPGASTDATDSLRECVNGLHQVHGTLVMLELKGVSLLADHLERVADELRNGDVKDVSGACQSLMQGILELPGYLEELQSGLPDSETSMLPLVNELRRYLGETPMQIGGGGIQLHGVADEGAIKRFEAIDGVGKTRKIRAVYQQVLLALLKGGDLDRAVETLRKVAQGMMKVCEGTPFAAQWQAFGEFVESLVVTPPGDTLHADAVKLLRRVDSEIREIAQTGSAALQRPVSINLVRQLLDAASDRGRRSAVLEELREASTQHGQQSDSLSLSGRQALVSAATALREELGNIKDRLDLFARGDGTSTADLADLVPVLKQTGSTLSLLGFESSKSIVLGQVEALGSLVDSGQADDAAILNIAGALVQVDENLASLTHSGKGEVEKITDEAQRAVALQTREGLDRIKQSIVDYVSSQWDVRHLQQTPAELNAIIGALNMIPLAQAAGLLGRCHDYLRKELMAGHVPSWEELDRLADALSGIDYYLERLSSDNPAGAEDILDVVQRSLDGLAGSAAAATTPADSEAAPAEPQPLYGAAEEVDVTAVGAAEDDEEPELELEADEDFDLGSALFDEIPGQASQQQEGSDSDELELIELEPAEPQDAETASTPEPASADSGEPATADAADAGGAEQEWELELEDDQAPRADAASASESDVNEPEVASSAELAPAEPEKPAASAAATPTLADSFESDDEIVEIFVEEVDEVLETVDEHLAGWADALTDEAHQTEIRRAFHTLKGSGRMVGANVLGEMAWSVENMLNRVLDATVAPSAEFVAVVRQARELAPHLKDAFEQKKAPEMSGVSRVMEQADVLASGGTLADTDEAQPITAQAQPGDAATVADSGSPEDDRGLFVAEAESHLDVLQAACRDGSFLLDDDAMRALHTLSGSAAMAGLASVGELAAPAYELAQLLRVPGTATTLAGEQGEFFRQATEAMCAMLADMKAGREPEDQFQLIADADRLQMESEADDKAQSALLGLAALDTLVKAGELLDGWQDGAMDLGLAEEVRDALAEVERVAHLEVQAEVKALAGALLGAHERFEFEGLQDDAAQVLRQGHETLLVQVDALAADQTPPAAAELGAALDSLRPAPAGQEPGPAVEGAFGNALAEQEAPEENLQCLLEEAPDDDVAEPAAAADDIDAAAEDFGFDLEELDLGAEDLPAEDLPAEDLEAGGQEAEPAEPANTAGTIDAQDAKPASEPAAASSSVDQSLLPEEVDEDIIAVFFEEADEILEALDHSINDWTTEPDNRLHLENMLRGLHTLKGGARLSGLTRLGDETHEFESLLIEFQESGRPAESKLFEALHARYDDIAALLTRTRAALAGEAPPAESAPRDVEPPVEFPAAQPVEPAEDRISREPADPAQAEDTAHGAPAPDNVAPFRPHQPQEPRPAQAREAEPREARPEAATAQARPAQEMVRVGAGLLENLVNLAGESSIIRARVEQGMSDFTNALDEMEITIERLREQLRRLEIETEAQILFRQERVEGPSYEDFDPLEMDRYSQLQQLSRSLGESASDMLDLKETLLYKARDAETLLLQQARVNTELQEGLMRSRMVPFSRLLPRLKRTVRQVAKELGKSVELNAFNIEGEMDRTLLERMVPPLEHMLRNAVDHGIETREQRRESGKAEAGRIDLRLSREGGDVVIEISDDGAGIDVGRVRVKAIERGLMSADANLRDEEISRFVFAPGFSTATSVTQISGRGVGMDVVASEVKQLGGSIDIFSQPGHGTRFVVRVPFTVSVNRALMVSVGEDLYAIPLNTIEGIVLQTGEELERLYAPDGHTFEYAGVPYRVQYLGNFLGRDFHLQPMQSSVPLVLVRSGEHAVAVHVDGVQGSREIVVKSLGPQFAGVGGISGATILGDGSVVVILDLVALIRTQSAAGANAGARTLAGAPRTRCVMVVDDSVTVRKVTSRLLERQGMDVIVAKDGVEAVSLLQERRPDVMLLDIEMPRMDGFEVLRQVRHDERLRSLPIVMISSRTGTKHQDRAAELGVSRFLGKPFQESELLATIDELVN